MLFSPQHHTVPSALGKISGSEALPEHHSTETHVANLQYQHDVLTLPSVPSVTRIPIDKLFGKTTWHTWQTKA